MNELKKTELGLIPKEWEVKKLVEISNINPENLPKETNNETIINYIDIESVLTGKILNIKKILFKFAPSRARRVIIKDDIIISTVRPYLKAIAMINTDSENLVCSTGFAVVRAKNNVLPKYIYQCILDDNFNNQLISKMVGSNYPAVTSKDIEQALLLIPPINEQNKIASILSTVDDLIENTDHLINSYTLLKKGLMQTLLTKGIEHTEFKKTEIGEIPVNWEIFKLGLIVELKHGYQFRENDLTKSGIPIIKIGQISNNRKLDFTNITFIGENRLSEFRDYLINNDDVLMSLTGNIGRVVIVKNLKGYAVQNYRVGKFIPDETKLNKQFLSFILESNYIYQQFNMLSNKTAQANFGKQDINKIKVLLPPIEEQQKISFLLSLIDQTFENYEYENEKLIELKQGLMQQLLTGKIRVNV